MRYRGSAVILSISLLITLFFISDKAEAEPAFARALNKECSMCHMSYPKLNETGIRFRANGYRLEEEEGRYFWEEPVKLGFIGSATYKNIDEEVAAGASGETVAHFSAAAEGETGGGSSATTKVKTSKFELDNLLIYSAGTLAPRVSYFTHLIANENQTVVELANVSLMDLVPHAGLNLRVGKMGVDLPFLSSARRLTRTDYLLQITQAAGHGEGATTGATLINTGAELNGIVEVAENHDLEYAFGIGNDNVTTSENNIGAYHAFINYTLHEQSIGFLYKHDRVGETENAQENTDAYGAAVELKLHEIYLNAAYFMFKRAASEGDVKINSGLAELGWVITPTITAVARYDFSDTQDSDEKATQIVASVIWYMSPNVKLQAEYAQRKDTDATGLDLTTNCIYGTLAFVF